MTKILRLRDQAARLLDALSDLCLTEEEVFGHTARWERLMKCADRAEARYIRRGGVI